MVAAGIGFSTSLRCDQRNLLDMCLEVTNHRIGACTTPGLEKLSSGLENVE